MHDVIIIGGGPSGLAAALSAKRQSLNYLVIERGVIANTVYNYPVARPLFSTSNELELEPGALSRNAKPTREQVLAHYADLVVRERLNIHTGEEVRSIISNNDSFVVTTSAAEYKACRVLVAVGGFGRQRKLNVPGESPQRVSYRFCEAHPFALKSVLVVGGGNSAAEAALFLAEAGAKVTLSLRPPSLDSDYEQSGNSQSIKSSAAKIKPWVCEPLKRAASEGRIKILTSSQVVKILSRSALLEVSLDETNKTVEVGCDHIFALIGADPDTRLLEQAGAQLGSDGRPIYQAETFETTIEGLYVAGHLTRELHMKNAIEVGQRVIQHIASSIFEKSVA